jgi:hypothetical protein
VPEEGRRVDAFFEDSLRSILTDLELVPDDRHFGIQILARHEARKHAVGLEIERPFEVLVGRGERFEVVRAIEPSRSVRAASVRRELLRDVAMIRAPFEEKMLEKVSHSRLAVALVRRADEIGDVHGRRLLRGIGEKEDPETVREKVFIDPFDGGDERDASGKRVHSRQSKARRENSDEKHGEPGESFHGRSPRRQCPRQKRGFVRAKEAPL